MENTACLNRAAERLTRSIRVSRTKFYKRKGNIMSKPWIHAQSSARKFGGVTEDYADLHDFLDSSKSVIADSRHRALTHTSWFVGFVMEKVFGRTRVNSDGKTYSVRDVGEQHILEDFGGKFIPSAQDYLQDMPFQEWMLRGKGYPESYRMLTPEARKSYNNVSNQLETLKENDECESLATQLMD